MQNWFTPTERLIHFSLTVNPGQTSLELQASTGTKTHKYLLRSLRTMILAGVVERHDSEGGDYTYTVVGSK
jgi:hypothetical protein